MAYVYRHIRLDKNIPFYIGIGNDDTYFRANDKNGRNKYWQNIANKTSYEVEIIIDNISWEDACKKEIEFIAIYGRKNDGGILANLTKGGEGKLGVAPANAFPKGHTPWMKGRKQPKEQIERLAAINRGRPSWNKGVKASPLSIEKQMKTKVERGKVYSGKDHPMYGKTHSDELKAKWRIIRKGVSPPNKGVPMKNKNKHPMVIKNIGRRIKVFQYSLNGVLINEFQSISDAADRTGVRKGNISHCISGNRKSSGGYIWSIQPPDKIDQPTKVAN